MEKTYTQMQEQKSQLEVTQLQVIKEQEVLGKQFKIYGTFEEPLFLATDVALWIENKNVSQMLRVVDDDEKALYTMYRVDGSTHKQWFLTEDGLYEVLMQSRKPIAKQFKKEVKQILKQIRRTGGYIPVNVGDTQEMIEQRAKEIASKTIAIKDELIAQQQAMIEQLQEENEQQQFDIDTYKEDVRYLFRRTDYGVHSISEAFQLVTHDVNGKRSFVQWFKDNNNGYVTVLDEYVDEYGSKKRNVIDLTEIRTFHKFKDLCFEFIAERDKKEIR